MKSFDETKSEIYEFINHIEFNRVFEGRSQYLKDKIEIMFEDIQHMIDEDNEQLKAEKSDISSILDILMYNAIEFSLSEYIANQINNISKLVYNYNDNSFKDDSLKVRSLFLSNFLDGYMSLRDCINLVRNLHTSCDRFAKFNPPTFELSKHYIDSLFDKPKEKEPKCGD